jgi:cytochrome oxidase Cu insertion factor (SCO1/SenC/PrrC family)
MSGSKLSNPATKKELPDAPLAMTVHDMPKPGEVAQADAKRTLSGRWKLIAMMLVCISPVVASYLTYYVIRPEGRSVYGELIEPQKDMPAITVVNREGQSFPLKNLRDQWLLVSVSSGSCNERCEQNLFYSRQLREVLGREKTRLDRVWLVTDTAPIDDKLQALLDQVQVLRMTSDTVKSWMTPGPEHQLEDHLYVVDPMGNFMMRFPANMDVEGASRAKRDLNRLLRASSSWDRAGR